MSYSYTPNTAEEWELWWKSEYNKRQFKALCFRLVNSDIENEILNNSYYLYRIKKSSNYSNIEVNQWLKNSWNTERILSLNLDIIQNTGQSFSMQWAFPQAYYAVFGSVVAMFKAIGYTEISHSAVLKKYAKIMVEDKLPQTISICCDGIDESYTFHNVQLPDISGNNVELDLNDSNKVDYYVCQFLKSTRRKRLTEKAPQMNFKTKEGKKRTRLYSEHWQRVSDTIGPTSILDFLYRKRIKGNYQDIETYNCPYFDGQSVMEDLLNIVSRINLVNEAYLSKAIGFENYLEMAKSQLAKVKNDYLTIRVETVGQIEKAIE